MANEMVRRAGDAQPIVKASSNPVEALLGNMLERCTTPEMLIAAKDTLKEMLAERRLEEDRQDKRDFSADLAALQGEIPTLIALKEVKGRDGNTRYKYLPLDKIQAAIKPYLARHGFGLYPDTRWEGNRGMAVIELVHRSGYTRKTEYAVVRQDAPPGGTATEGEEGTLTRALRRGICFALNIAVTPEDAAGADATALGDLISPDLAAEFERRCKAANCASAFLKVAESETFAGIRTNKVELLEARLQKKERERENTPPPDPKDADLILAVHEDTGADEATVRRVLVALRSVGGGTVTKDMLVNEVRRQGL